MFRLTAALHMPESLVCTCKRAVRRGTTSDIALKLCIRGPVHIGDVHQLRFYAFPTQTSSPLITTNGTFELESLATIIDHEFCVVVVWPSLYLDHHRTHFYAVLSCFVFTPTPHAATMHATVPEHAPTPKARWAFMHMQRIALSSRSHVLPFSCDCKWLTNIRTPCIHQ